MSRYHPGEISLLVPGVGGSTPSLATIIFNYLEILPKILPPGIVIVALETA